MIPKWCSLNILKAVSTSKPEFTDDSWTFFRNLKKLWISSKLKSWSKYFESAFKAHSVSMWIRILNHDEKKKISRYS